MLNSFAFSILLFYFSPKPKLRKLKPIYFFLGQTPQPLHWGLNGFTLLKWLRCLCYWLISPPCDLHAVAHSGLGDFGSGVVESWGRWFY